MQSDLVTCLTLLPLAAVVVKSFLRVQVFFSVWVCTNLSAPLSHMTSWKTSLSIYPKGKIWKRKVEECTSYLEPQIQHTMNQYRHLFLFDKCRCLIKGTLQKFENYLIQAWPKQLWSTWSVSGFYSTLCVKWVWVLCYWQWILKIRYEYTHYKWVLIV